MLLELRDEGWSYDEIELWAVGYPGQEDRVDDMNGEDRTESIFIDSTLPDRSFILAFDAHNNDIFFIDRNGHLRGMYNAGGTNSLYTDANYNTVHTIIMALLEEEEVEVEAGEMADP